MAEDIVRKFQCALDFVECTAGSHDVEHSIETVVLFVNWVCKTTLAPPIRCSVHNTANALNGFGDGVNPVVCGRLFEVAAHNDH